MTREEPKLRRLLLTGDDRSITRHNNHTKSHPSSLLVIKSRSTSIVALVETQEEEEQDLTRSSGLLDTASLADFFGG